MSLARLRSAPKAIAAGGLLAATTTTTYLYNKNNNNNINNSSCEKRFDKDFRIEIDLISKIRQKPYIPKDANNSANLPATIRLLTIDLPEIKTRGFTNGECHLSLDESSYPSNIAPPKRIMLPSLKEQQQRVQQEQELDNDENIQATSSKNEDEIPIENAAKQRLEEQQKLPSKEANHQKKKLVVVQKTLAKTLIQCQTNNHPQLTGFEILETSISDLNKYSIRKVHQLGEFTYDPGKYFDNSHLQNNHQSSSSSSSPRGSEFQTVEDYEIEAPWNQYAWIEELKLRIGGKVEFGAPMEPASWLGRRVNGTIYKSTIPSSRKFWHYIVPWYSPDPNGVDTSSSDGNSYPSWSSNKPHAVIVNGAAMQRVPSSLRIVQKFCKDSDVPLFVIYDPRAWGSNTHSDLNSALYELRRTIKYNIIQHALQQSKHPSSTSSAAAFAYGRLIGKMESDTKWHLQEQKRKAEELFGKGQRYNHRRRSTLRFWEDWSGLDETELEKKLIEHSVIQQHKKKKRSKFSRNNKIQKEAQNQQGDESIMQRTYSSGMVAIAKRCIKELDDESVASNSDSSEQSSLSEAKSEPDLGSPTSQGNSSKPSDTSSTTATQPVKV